MSDGINNKDFILNQWDCSNLSIGELYDIAYQQGRADERKRIVNELENLSDQYFQKVALDIIDIAIEIVRGGENE